MTKKRFYQISLLLPLLLPLVLLPFENIGPIFLLSLTFGGIPYLLLMALMLYLSNNRDYRFLERVGWYAPPVFGVIVGVFWLAIDTVNGPYGVSTETLGSLAGGILVFTIFACAFGYFYVVLVRLLGYAFWGSEKS